MKIKDLIDKLSKLDPNLIVISKRGKYGYTSEITIEDGIFITNNNKDGDFQQSIEDDSCPVNSIFIGSH